MVGMAESSVLSARFVVFDQQRAIAHRLRVQEGWVHGHHRSSIIAHFMTSAHSFVLTYLDNLQAEPLAVHDVQVAKHAGKSKEQELRLGMRTTEIMQELFCVYVRRVPASGPVLTPRLAQGDSVPGSIQKASCDAFGGRVRGPVWSQEVMKE